MLSMIIAKVERSKNQKEGMRPVLYLAGDPLYGSGSYRSQIQIIFPVHIDDGSRT